VDLEGEQSYSFSLKESMRRAKTRGLLTGKVVFVSAKVKTPKETLQELVECAGGKVSPFT